MIWGAGRDGKEFYKALSERGRELVDEWWDIDPGKVGNVYPPPVRLAGMKRAREGAGGASSGGGGGSEGDGGSSADAPALPQPPLPLGRPLPIRHFSTAQGGTRSVAVCVAADAGGEELLSNIALASAAIVAKGGAPLVAGENLFFLC